MCRGINVFLIWYNVGICGGGFSIITLKNLSKIYNSSGNIAIGLQNINITFNKGEFVGIVGPSGSGKTTLLNVVSGMDTYEEGELVLFGSETSSYTQEDFETYRRNNVAFIFQNYQLIDSYTVLDNVVMELLLKGVPLGEAKNSAREILSRVGLSHRLKNRASKLSGGEKQRVVIARALASDCQVLACDEPTGNLDSKNSVKIINLLKEISTDKLVLMVTHEPDLIKDVATRIVTVKDGMIDSDEVITKVEEDNSSSLVKKHVDFKTRFYLGIKNILSTPKRSILVLMVFFLLSFGVVLMIGGALSIDSYYSSNYFYENKTDERVIVYNNPDVDISKYVTDAIEIPNDFFLGNRCVIDEVNIDDIKDLLYEYPYLGVYNESTKLTYGKLPSASNEIILEIPSYMYSSGVDEKTLENNPTIVLNEMTYKVVGLISSNSYEYRIYFYENNFDLIKENSEIVQQISDDVVFYEDGKKVYCSFYAGEKSEIGFSDEVDIQIPKCYENKEFEIYIGNIKLNWQDYNYEYVEQYDNDVFVSTDFLDKFLEENICRTSYFFNSLDDAKEASKLINKAGGTSTHPASYKSNDDMFMYYFSLFSFIFQIVIIVGTILFVLVITSFIIGLILKTTVRDYTIMRIIGLTKYDILEMLLIQMSVTALLSYVLVIIVSKSVLPIYFGQFEEFNLWLDSLFTFKIAVLSILCILISALFIGYKHHNKMFRKSASYNLRGGDLLW